MAVWKRLIIKELQILKFITIFKRNENRAKICFKINFLNFDKTFVNN